MALVFAEQSLAHLARNKVEATYYRSDLLVRMQKVIEAKAGCVDGERRDQVAGPAR
ncbi:MAG: hypothetical protein OXN89_05475 [Bryobacterales bacterium]|nr:hypothetical protein [Bryobacterales bacterium]